MTIFILSNSVSTKTIKKLISFLAVVSFFAVVISGYWGLQSGDNAKMPDRNNEVSAIVRQIHIFEKLGVKSSAEKEQLRNALVARKDKLLAEVKKNPKSLAENRLPEETLRGIPAELQDLVEKDTQLEGKFISAVLDYKDGRHDNVYALKSAGVNYHVYFAEPPKSVQKTAEKATIKGLGLGSTVVLASSGSESLISESWGYDPLNEYGEQKTLVLMMNFTNDTSAPFSSSAVADQIVNNSNSTDKYYREVSYYSSAPATGIYFSAVARGYYTVPFNSATTACDVVDNENWADAADQMAVSDGVNLATYNRRAYLFPNVNPCGWAGLAYVGGDHSWYNGYNDSMLWSHELGHNLGEGHASTRDCGAVTIDVYASCSESEYGDNYDTMGNWNLYHVNAAHKVNDGWIPPSRVIDTSTGGTFTISPIETYTTSPQVLRIRKPNTSDYYYFEYRQPVGFDSTLPTGLTRGATAQLWNNVFWDNTYAVDFTPADGFNDIAMTDGQTFTDTINGISVTQVSHGATLTLTVEITKHMIEASTGVSGSISPPGNTLVNNGGSQTFNMVPDAGYSANEVFIDGVSIGRVNSYTFTNVTTDHTIYATFSIQLALNHFVMAGHTGDKVAGQSFDVTLTAYDQNWDVFNDYAGIVTVTSNDSNATLPTDSGAGWQNGQKVFSITLTKAPSANVIFTDGSFSAGNAVSVLPAALNHIDLSPSTAQVITAPSNVTFSAHGYDIYDNSVTGPSYTWTGTNYLESGHIGDCKTPGVYQVYASSGGLNSPNVQVTINPGPASSVTISTTVATLTAGQTSQLTAVAKDVCATVVSTPALTWTNADAGGLFGNTTAGNHIVSAISGSIQSNNVYIRVNPAAPDHVDISPSTEQIITAGTTIQFSANSKDQYGNIAFVGPYTWTGTNQYLPGRFNNHVAGDYLVSATVVGLDSIAVPVRVNPAALSSISISPSATQTVSVGELINFSAQAEDVYGNDILGPTYTWTGTNSTGLFTNGTPGTYQVKASSNGIVSALVTVNVLSADSVFPVSASLWLSNLSPIEGESVNGAFTIQNTSTREITISAGLADMNVTNGQWNSFTPQDTQPVAIAAGAQKTSTFNRIARSPGTHVSWISINYNGEWYNARPLANQLVNFQYPVRAVSEAVSVSASLGFSNLSPAAGETLSIGFGLKNTSTSSMVIGAAAPDINTQNNQWNSFSPRTGITIAPGDSKYLTFQKVVKSPGIHRTWIAVSINGSWYDARSLAGQLTQYTYEVRVPNIRMNYYYFEPLPPKAGQRFDAHLSITNLEKTPVIVDAGVPVRNNDTGVWNTMLYSAMGRSLAPNVPLNIDVYQTLQPGGYTIWPSICTVGYCFNPKTSTGIEMFWAGRI